MTDECLQGVGFVRVAAGHEHVVYPAPIQDRTPWQPLGGGPAGGDGGGVHVPRQVT